MFRAKIALGAVAAALSFGAVAGAVPAYAAKGNVLVFARANNGLEGGSAAAELRSMGYAVTLTETLPSDLAQYTSVWSILAYEGLTPEEIEELHAYVSGGGKLYLTGERPCCESLDLSDQTLLRSLLKDQEIVVGQQGDIPGELRFNPAAKDHITSEPNVLEEFPASAPGGVAGIGNISAPNVLASNGSIPVGGVFDESDMLDGQGRVVLYMDIDWLRGYAPPATRHAVIENIEDFLEKTPKRVAPASDEYVALGDSYASGLGSFSYLEGTTGKKNSCYRATNGYVEEIARESGDSLDFAACAGATIGSLWEGKSSQLVHVGPDTRLVTLSIGGNDVGFSGVLQSCVGGLYSHGGGKGCAERDGPAAEEALGWLRYGREPGKYELPGKRASSTNKQRLPSLVELYEGIIDQAPGAEVIVVGYPLLFESDEPEFTDCQVGTAGGIDKLTIAAGDVQWIVGEEEQLDDLIHESVETARSATGGDIKFADTRPIFLGHGICDTEETWINPLLFEGIVPPHPKQEDFHPTVTGQEAIHYAIILAHESEPGGGGGGGSPS